MLFLVAAAVILAAVDASRIHLYNGSTVHLWSRSQDIGRRLGCDHTSLSVVSCIHDYVDTNHDDGITEEEIDAAKDKYMHWYELLFDNIVSSGSSKDIRMRCDVNNNELIDVDDLIAWSHECAQYTTDEEASAQKGKLCLCNCEAIDTISKYICDRAKQ